MSRPTPRQPRPAPQNQSYAWLWGAGAVAAAVLVYLPALRNGFIWDDPLVLEQLRAIHGLRDLLVPPDIIPKYYFRPLIFLSFLFDRTLGGETPFWFHFSVVMAHALNTGLVWWLGVRLFGHAHAAALAAGLFAVHPIHVESVSWIAGRSDVLAATFLLLTALLLSYERPLWTASLAVATYALALLCKEAALGGLLVLPLLDPVLRRRPRWGTNAALVGATAGYLALRRMALGGTVTGFATAASPTETLRNLLAAIGFYISKLFAPTNLSAYVPEVPAGWLAPALGLLAGGLAVAAALLAWRRGERAVSALLVWFLVTLAPSLVVIIRYSAQAPVADRYLYLPSLAACLLIARAHPAGSRPRTLITIAMIIVSVIFAGLTVARNRVWSDDVLFWQDVAAKAPDYALGHRELAMIYLNRNQVPEADAAIQRALQGKSDPEARVMTLNNAATIYLRQQRLDDAERVLNEALTIHPHPYLYYGLGRVAMSRAEQAQARGEGDEVRRQVLLARDHLQRSLALEPRDPKTHILLGQVLWSLKDRAGAREHLQRGLQLGAHGSVADVARRFLQMVGP